MKICLIHNEYGKLSGEEVVVRNLLQLLEQQGHAVVPYMRSSSEIEQTRFGPARAFFSGVYNAESRKTIGKLLEKEKPDVVHVHNVFPLISPSVLIECRKRQVPVVMTVHNYRLICPSGLFAHSGKICEKCSGGHEYWCLLNNCENSIFKSAGYALRNWVARRQGFFQNNVTLFATLTDFQRQRLIAEGYDASRITVIPNAFHVDRYHEEAGCSGDYMGFVGRISPEKGVDLLIGAAERQGDIAFKIAGASAPTKDMQGILPLNIEFCGYLGGEQLARFYQWSRCILLTSKWYEGFPMVILEAMLHAKSVICPRIGGLPEIVEDGVNGLLFEPGKAEDLSEKIQYLWDRPELCRKMGEAGREKAIREYSPGRYYQRLMAAYEKAVNF